MKNQNITLSLAIFLYFTGLVVISHYRINMGVVAEGIVEFVTLPLMLGAVILYLYSLRKWHKEHWNLCSTSFISIMILTLTTILMTFATIYNI